MATWDRYKNTNPTGLEIRVRSGGTFHPRSYCDDPTLGPVGIYVAKEPVCKLSMTPNPQFSNTNIAWDISDSVSSTGTIDTFDIAWGGTTDIGDLADQAWASDPKTGNVQYTTPGTYTVTATVTDLLGKTSKEAKLTVTIIELEATAYIGTTDGGLFTLTPTAGPTAANTGLSGDQLKFRAVHIHPAYKDLASNQIHLWACTADGVSYSADGGGSWTNISKATLGAPENAAGDDPAPATADLDQIDIAFDPQDVNRVYLRRGTATRTWLYWTEDYGANWDNESVGLP